METFQFMKEHYLTFQSNGNAYVQWSNNDVRKSLSWLGRNSTKSIAKVCVIQYYMKLADNQKVKSFQQGRLKSYIFPGNPINQRKESYFHHWILIFRPSFSWVSVSGLRSTNNSCDPWILRAHSNCYKSLSVSYLSSYFWFCCRHLLFSPRGAQSRSGATFPGLVNLMSKIEKSEDPAAQWEKVKHHLSVVIFTIHSAADSLTSFEI